MTAQGLRQVRVCKMHKVVLKATIKEEGDDAAWVLPPAPKVVGMAESLFGKALAGIVKEMKASWKSLERIVQDVLEVSCDMLSQTMALVDLVEQIVQGKHFVRMREMGWPESDGEELPMRWSKKGKGKAQEAELEEEVEEEGEPEVEPEDVDMTLAE